MAYYSQNGTGIDSNAYIYVQLQVTRTDYDTYSHFDLKSVAVSDTGTSGFIRGQVTTNQGGTSWTTSTGWKDVYYNGTTTLATSSFNINRGSSDGTVRCGAYAEGGGSGIYAGGTDYAWLNVTVPKVESPNAPSNCSASYVSDSSASVSWTNGSTTTARPRTATLVERKTDGGSWVQVASVGSSVTNWTDNGISANHSYLYRVRAQNSAGYSAYSTAPSMIFTTPAAPSDVLLNKTAATTVQLDVSGSWPYTATFDVQSTYDGGSTWASVATSTSLPYSATVSAGTVQFRVRAVRGALSSAWTNSASLVTICPPLAPTIVQAPASPTANGSTVVVAWSPNHPDGSSQTSVQVKMTRPNGTSVTYTLSTATSWTSPALVTDGTYSVQVHTKGLDPSYGDWSQSVSWVVATPPAVVITSPATDGADVSALPLDIEWSVTDSTGVSTQRVIIEGDGGEILNRTLAGDVRTLSLAASDVDLTDGETYTIRIRVMGGSGLVTEQTRIFDVAWLAPAAPVLQLTEGEGRSATIDVMDTHYSESGATIAVDGSAIADSFTVFGKSTQDGTPTPSAPVPIESAGYELVWNQLYAATASSQTINGVTVTKNQDGSTTIGGTATASSSIIFMPVSVDNGLLKQGHKYLLKGCPSGGSSTTYYVSVAGLPIDLGDGGIFHYTYSWTASQFRFDFKVGAVIPTTTTWPQYIDLTEMFGAGNEPTLDEFNAMFPLEHYDYDAGTDRSEAFLFVKDSDDNLSATSVDLQGNSLRSLPDVTRDELRVGERKVLGKRVGRVVLDGSETFYMVTSGYQTYFDYVDSTAPLVYGATTFDKRAYTMSNITTDARNPDNPNVSDASIWVYALTSDTQGIRIRLGGGVISSLTSVAALQQWLAATNVEILYKLATPQEIDLGAASDHPFIPDGGEMWVDGTEMDAVLRPADYAGQPTIDSVDVQRVNADGTAWTVATGLTVGGSCIDPLPPLGVDYTYRAVASAASGATSSVEVSNRLGGCKWALNFGQAASACKLVGRNPSSSVSYEHGGELYHFARGFQNPEDMLPEFYPVGSIDANGTLEFDAETRDEANEIMALMFQYPIAWLRTPFGERRRVRVKPTYNLDRRTKRITVSYDLIRFGEAW